MYVPEHVTGGRRRRRRRRRRNEAFFARTDENQMVARNNFVLCNRGPISITVE